MQPARSNPHAVEWRLHPDYHRPSHLPSDTNWTTFERFPTRVEAEATLTRQRNREAPAPLFEFRLKPTTP